MGESDSEKLESILANLETGDVDPNVVTRRLFDLVYSELHNAAHRLMRSERPNHTLQTTALIHEVYIKLMKGKVPKWESRAHFFGAASRAMRQILVDHARYRHTARRGGDWQRVTLNDNLGLGGGLHEQIIDLDAALVRLAQEEPRLAQVSELTIFCGLTMNEISEILGTSLRTAQNDWRVARMWLTRDLAGGSTS